MTRNDVLVVAAGRGQRFGGPNPKQYSILNGEFLIRRTLRAFTSHPEISKVLVSIHPDDEEIFNKATRGLKILSVSGGATRQESVLKGLEAMAEDPPDRVLIHDGARPMVTARLINSVITGLTKEDGILPVIPIVETLKNVEDGRVGSTVLRNSVFLAQTPQGFRYSTILDAHRKYAGENLTDDAAVMERAGSPVITIPGDKANIKVTIMEDLAYLRKPLSETRAGIGYDVHKFGPGDHVILCGIKVAHSHGLIGNSDADVALHAATDAILGAIGAGDIGHHFPPNDAKWSRISSKHFLRHAHDLLSQSGGSLVNLDITIVCERPKIGVHRDSMVRSIANILNLDASRISVKATTTEGLGFTGREEGIAAQAIATVRV